MKIPLNRMYVDQEIRDAVMEVLDSGRYVKGPRAKEMEVRFAELVGSKHAVSCSSGSTALMLAFKALDVGPKDEVIVPSHTFIATLNGFWHYGARPRFVDIDPDTYAVDTEKVKEAVNERTAGIVPVHLYGHPADMGELTDIAEEAEVPLVGDAAQAHGAKYRGQDIGSMGDMTCYSFFPSKVITVAGEGGMITCDDDELYELLKALRNHGRYSGERDISSLAGFNMRMPEILAAVGSIQLDHMADWVSRRREIAKVYTQELEGTGELVLPKEMEWAEHVYYLYVIRTGERDALREHLRKKGISTGIHYSVPVHRMPYIESPPELPVTERIVREILSLPMHPLLSEEEQKTVIEGVREFSGG
ncbi:MAG: DegT/DnrJ/EryC1/StrS family aminotransferase [Thermoplasmatota archaeon]